MSSNNKFFGIIPFMDPQKLINEKTFALDKRSDIYSLGVILWEISSCRIPFPKKSHLDLIMKICNDGLREDDVKGTPMQYIQIYTKCWQSEPDSRPLISQILLYFQSMSLEPVFEDSDENSEEISTSLPASSKNSSGIIINLLFYFFHFELIYFF
jgi:serine/threonine protein kinase